MCFLMDTGESEDAGYSSSTGATKVQLRRHHTWLIPRNVLKFILGVALILCIVGMILLAIGGGIGSTGLRVTGGILFALGVIGILVSIVICQYAYFVYGTKDQSVQTDITWTDDYLADQPGYSSIGRPSALKSADSTLKRNGLAGQKKVTMAPEIGPYGENQPNVNEGVIVDSRLRPQMTNSPSFGSGTVYFGEAADPRGVGGRNVAGAEVGTGGIRITTLERNQPFPSPGSHVVYGGGQSFSGSGSGQAGYGAGQVGYGAGQAGYGAGQVGYGTGQGHAFYSGGGSSASSSVDANYAYPKSLSVVGGIESGFSDSGSQYSTLRSIPVTHIVSDSQRQQQDSMEYARINKHGKTIHTLPSDSSLQRGYFVQGQGFSQGQEHVNQFEQRFAASDDLDYDNPVERTPMISPKQNETYGQSSYHKQQMQYQRQHSQQDLHAPRQLNIQSLQRQTANNPYNYQDENHHHQLQYQSSSPTPLKVTDDDLPELQPLVYPSARRPMTFEQVSSSKMSVYDNVLAGLKDSDE